MTIVFLNDHFVTKNSAVISVADRGFLLGDGIFETIRIYKGKALFLHRHYLRLANSAKILDIPLHHTKKKFRQIIEKLLTAHQFTEKDAIARITLTRGDGERGLTISASSTPTCLVAIFPYTPKKDRYKLIVSQIRRNEFSLLANIKSLNYLDNILAYQQAVKQQADDALMLNTHDHVACTTTANIFMVKNNALLTPLLKDGALPGIMRRIIMENAEDLHINVVEKCISLSELKLADGVFTTNSIYGIRTVTCLDDVSMDFSANNKLIQQLVEKLKNDINQAIQL